MVLDLLLDDPENQTRDFFEKKFLGKKKAFVAEIETEKAAKKKDLVDKPAEENQEEE